MKKRTVETLLLCVLTALFPTSCFASDAPSDEGYYYWQDENGDFWMRNGSEDIYIGSENDYYMDEDTGVVMENNDAGWDTDDSMDNQDDDFVGYYWQDEEGNIYYYTGSDNNYIGTTDEYYIGDDGYLYGWNPEYSEENQDHSDEEEDSESESSLYPESEYDDSTEAEAEIYLSANLPKDAELIDSSDDSEGGYTEVLSYENGLTTITIHKTRIDWSDGVPDAMEYMSGMYDMTAYDSWETVVDSYPATRFVFDVGENEDASVGNALFFATDTYIYSMTVLTDADYYDEDSQELTDFWMDSAKLITLDLTEESSTVSEGMVDTDFYTITLPEEWSECTVSTEKTLDAGYSITLGSGTDSVLTITAKASTSDPCELESVWQGYLGRITGKDGDFDLVYTISQTVPDASTEWKAMYDTYQDLLSLITMKDGYVLTEGEYIEYQA